MSIYLSPGVYTQEVNLTDVVPAVATASAAIVGYSAKGSTDNLTLITNDQQFIQNYGKPDPSSGHYFHYAALAYLAQGNKLWCLRVENGALYGGANIMATTSSESNAALNTGKASATFSVASGLNDDVLFQVVGTNPGVWNDKIGIRIQNVKDGTDSVVVDQYTFEIVVYYQNDDGDYEQLELWKVSRQTKVDGFGKQLNMESKINDISDYIKVLDNTSLANTVLPQAQATTLALGAGSDGSAISASDVVSGWSEFENPDDVDVRILINGGETDVAVQNKMLSVAGSRYDCIAILDTPWASVQSVTDTVTFRTTTLNANSSYGALYAPWVQILDSYNDQLIYVPPSGHVAAQMAYTDFVAQPWYAPAGMSRGQLDVITPSYIYTEGERDTLYTDQINMIQLFRGEGTVVWGQRTLQSKFSALSSVNVRRLLIILEKSIAIALRSFVHEPNNQITRFRVTSLIESYLARLSAQGAFQTELGDDGYHVVCDETNNTPAVIDNLEMRISVFIKPIRAAEFIKLTVVNSPTGASFEEQIAKGIIF